MLRCVVFVCVLALCSCGRGPTVESRLDEARRLVEAGDLLKAEAALASVAEDGSELTAVQSWRSRLLRAEILVIQRKSSEALPLLAETAPGSAGETHEIRRMIVLASACAQTGQAERAEELLGAAFGRASDIGDKSLLAEVEQRRAVAAMSRQNIPSAREHLGRALGLAREAGNEVLQSKVLANLGVLEGRRNRFSEAVDDLESALAISDRLGMKSHSSKILGNLGWCHRALGEYDRAQERLVAAARLAGDFGLTGDQQLWLVNLGNLEFDRARFAEAEGYYSSAIQIKASSDLPAAYNNLAQTSLQLGKTDQAEEYFRRSMELKKTRSDPVSLLHGRLTAARIGVARGRTKEAETELRRLVTDAAGQPLLQWEAHADLAALLASGGKTAEASREYAAAISILARTRSELLREEHRLSFQASQMRFYDDYIKLLMDGGKYAEALAVADFSRTRSLEERLAAEQRTSAVAPVSSLRLLRGDTLALVYWLGDGKSYLWSVAGSRIAGHELPPRRDIEKAIEEYRRVLVSPLFDEAAVRWRGQELYQMLIGPAQRELENYTRLAVVADRALHTLDFGSLTVPAETTRFLIEDAAVVYMPALRVRSAQPETKPTRLLLALGNAVSKDSRVPPLAEAGDEIRKVASHFDSARTVIVEGESAIPSAYAANHPSTFRYIHLAAHGTGNSVNPLQSALLLTPGPQGFRLYAQEILKVPISADVVTISACFGSGTKAYAGEGLVGLAWAFLRAGARTVISTLTEVSDAATPRLMDRLYADIARGKDPAAALQAAKLELLRSDTVYRRPQYWAPFVAYSRE